MGELYGLSFPLSHRHRHCRWMAVPTLMVLVLLMHRLYSLRLRLFKDRLYQGAISHIEVDSLSSLRPASANSTWYDIVAAAQTRSQRRLERLYHSSCLNYYSESEMPSTWKWWWSLSPGLVSSSTAYARGHELPLVTTREESCLRGTELIILPKFKIIYVVVKKAASSTIRRFFNTFFQMLPYEHGEFLCREHERNVTTARLCNIHHVDPEVINSYFIFSISREPIARFYSALKESNLQASKQNKSMPYQEREDVVRLLQEQMGKDGNCRYNPHLDSQLKRLFSRFEERREQEVGEGQQHTVPLDFLGSLDCLAEDMLTAIVLAAQRAGAQLDQIPLPEYHAYLANTHARPAERKSKDMTEVIDAIHDEELDDMVRGAHGQDLVCLV